MDYKELGILLLGIAFFIFLIQAVIAAAEEDVYGPYRAEKANSICIERGFDQYDSFRSIPWSYDVLGVKCENI